MIRSQQISDQAERRTCMIIRGLLGTAGRGGAGYPINLLDGFSLCRISSTFRRSVLKQQSSWFGVIIPAVHAAH